MKYGKKAKKLIRKGAAVPFERTWQRKKLKCHQASKYFETLKWGKNLVKQTLFFRIRRHIRKCPLCGEKGGFILKL
jgi:hypothetical protein